MGLRALGRCHYFWTGNHFTWGLHFTPKANPGQIFEVAAGKVAQKTGETFKTKNFEGRDDWEKIKSKMDEEGVELKEDFVDPETGKTIPDVAMGPQYNAKLKHMLEKKFSARGMRDG